MDQSKISNSPLVSIIIVNWNGGEVLRQCLISLSKIDYQNWELIVVDNGSTDGSLRSIRYVTGATRIRLIKNKKNLGFAVANNQGYKKSRGKYILLLNNDTRVEKDFLSRLVGRIEEDPSVAVIQPKIFLMDKPGYLDNAGSFLTKIGFLSHWGFGQKNSKEFSKEREIFSAKGACMLIRMSVVDKVGLFDGDFVSYFEESDFCWRVWMAGYRVIFYPLAIIYHKLGFTIRRLGALQLNFHYYKNRICSLLKNLEARNLLLIFIPHMLISEALFLLFLLRGKFAYSLMIEKAIVWNLWNLPQTLKKRRRVQQLRKVSDRALFKAFLHPIRWAKLLGDLRRLEEDLRRKAMT